MEELLTRMQGFLQMDGELDAAEFNAYYKDVMDFLQRDFGELDQDGLVKMYTVTSIMGMNAMDRSARKDADAKKFKKISEKSGFWHEAIAYKLEKSFGMSRSAIDEASDQVFGPAE